MQLNKFASSYNNSLETRENQFFYLKNARERDGPSPPSDEVFAFFQPPSPIGQHIRSAK